MAKRESDERNTTMGLDYTEVSLKALLYGLYHVRKVPVYVWSDPGQGKTQIINRVANQLEVNCITKSLNKMEPTDLNGVPYLDKDDTLNYSEPEWIKSLKAKPNSVLFFDELNTAAPDLQGAALTVIQDCEVGDLTIPKTTFRIAAGNPGTVVGTQAVSAALMNRFIHINYQCDPIEWSQGIILGFEDETECIVNDEEMTAKKRLFYRTAVSDFIKSNPNYLNTYDDMSEDPAFASPRSWENLIECLSVLDENNASYIRTLMNGCIGQSTAAIFSLFLKDYVIAVDLTLFLGNPEKIRDLKVGSPDLAMQIMQSAHYYLRLEPTKWLEVWCEVVNRLHAPGGTSNYDNLIVRYVQSAEKLLSTKGSLAITQKMRTQIGEVFELVTLKATK